MMKWIFLLLLFIPSLAFGQSYNALTYTAGSFNQNGCGGRGGVCQTDLMTLGLTLPNGTLTYCKDCAMVVNSNTCASGGNGALAVLVNGTWLCGISPISVTPPASVATFPPGPVSITGNTGNGTDQISDVSINGLLNVQAMGAYGDAQVDYNSDCTMGASANTVTCPSITFTSSDVGKTVFIPNFITATITGTSTASGLVQLTVNSTTGLNTANKGVVIGVGGTYEANGSWNFTIVDGTHVKLTGSSYANAYTSGGSFYNTSQSTIISTITAASGHVITVATANGATARTNQNVFWAHDDTTAFQSAWNSTGWAGIAVPPASYLVRGLNFTTGHPGVKFGMYGQNGFGSATIWAVGVTDPGGHPGATTVGIQSSGYYDTIKGLMFIGGFHGAPDTAPTITFLAARIGSSGYDFSIVHDMDSDMWETNAIDGYGYVNYGSEQTSFENPSFTNTLSSKAVAMFSGCNTPAFVSPYGTLVAASTSMTHIGITGKKSVVAGWNAGNQNGGGLIVLDNACNTFSIYDYDLNDIYVNSGNSVFIRDTYTGSSTAGQMRGMRLRGFYGEPQTPSDVAIKIHSMVANSDIQGQYYTFAGWPAGHTTWSFDLGFVNSRMDTDQTGNAVGGTSNFYAATCASSYLNLGIQAGTIGGCSDWLWANGFGYGGALVNSNEIHTTSIGVDHLTSYGSSPTLSTGSLQQTGSDSFGKIINFTPPVTLTFHRNWGGAYPACVLTDDGVPYLWYTSAQGPNSVTFNCVVPSTGAACTGLQDVSYHCAAQLPTP